MMVGEVRQAFLIYLVCGVLVGYILRYMRSVDWWGLGVLIYEMMVGEVRQTFLIYLVCGVLVGYIFRKYIIISMLCHFNRFINLLITAGEMYSPRADPRSDSRSLVLWWACLNLHWIWACK